MLITADLIREAIAVRTDATALHRTIDVSRAKAAAVLVPVFFEPEPHALLVLRGSQLADHAGEVGFPGGKPEPGDADLYATAVREMEEEIAVDASRVELLGTLMPVPVITGRYLIHPYVGAIAAGPPPRIASTEVARILRLPLMPLITGEHPMSAVRGEWRGATVLAPHIEVEGAILYGASAYIFYEMLVKIAARLGRDIPSPRIEPRPPWGDRYPQ